jgi:lipopolysaccharide exporter
MSHSSAPADPSPSARPNDARGIGHATAHGFAWLFGQSIGEKLVTLAGQIALARLLTKSDFNLIALTYTVTTFAGLLQQAGLSQVLVQRHRRFRLWATPVFWMSLAIGLAAGAATAAAAPLAAGFYHNDKLVGLLLTAALLLPLNSLLTVPEALLRGQMRFRLIAAANMGTILGTVTLSVVFAWMGFGAYSFLIPQPVVAVARGVLMWWASRPRIHARLRVRRWRYLISDSTMLLIASVALMVTYQGGQAILGRLYPLLPAAGVFYFAWNLSDQSLRLLVNNLAGVLFPALNRIQDEPKRQAAAFLRATRALLTVGLPICLLQAALAEPAIRLVFSARWADAAPVMAALSLGMAARLILGPSESMFLAQRRFGTYMRLSAVYAAAYLVVVTLGATLAGAEHAASGAALATGVCLAALAPISLKLAIRPAGGTWRDVGRVYAAPLATSLCVFAPVATLVWLMPRTAKGDLTVLASAAVFAAVACPLLVRVLDPEMFKELVARVGGILRRRSAEGVCAACGYDLRSLPERLVCPECGAPVAVVPP